MRESTTPSEGVRRDGKRKTAPQRIQRNRGDSTPSKGVEKCGNSRLLRKESGEMAEKPTPSGRERGASGEKYLFCYPFMSKFVGKTDRIWDYV